MLEDHQCLIVAVPLAVTDDELQRAYDCLDTDERSRSERFVTIDLRRRFSVCRGRLRMLLAAILEASPQKIEFEYGSLGKPYLRSSVDLQFNVSHSQDWALMAFAKCSPVGVDIEFCDRRMNHEAIASQLLSEAELAQWNSLPNDQQRNSLLSIWVSKEAILKSLGLGITTSLRKLELPVPLPSEGFEPCIVEEFIAKAEAAEPFPTLCRFRSLDWKLRFIDAVPNASAAVCYASNIKYHTARHWDQLRVMENSFCRSSFTP